MPAKPLDRTGKRYGTLTALYPTDKRDSDGTIIWHCRCDCGKEIDVGKRLNKIESCGCISANKNKVRLQDLGKQRRKDLTNQRFGRLIALYPTNIKHPTRRSIIWHCKCDCGNEVDILSEYLLEQKTQSCGCLKSELTKDRSMKDLKGKKFGKLLVLEETQERSQGSYIIWKCKCDCGNIVNVSSHNLNNGITRSCGCTKSFGEQKITEYLQNKGICFKKEFAFEDLRNKKNNKLRFDYAIFDESQNLKFLIEYQGIQHYIDCGEFGRVQREETDKLKKDYCQKNNIILYEIKYDEDIKDKLEELFD